MFLVKWNSLFYIPVLCITVLIWAVENSAIDTEAWIVQAVIFENHVMLVLNFPKVLWHQLCTQRSYLDLQA